MKQLSYSQQSLDDLDEILVYISRDNPPAAERFVEDLIASCESLQTNPELGTRCTDLATNLRRMTYRGYGIYYRFAGDDVVIERVLHPALDAHRQSFD